MSTVKRAFGKLTRKTGSRAKKRFLASQKKQLYKNENPIREVPIASHHVFSKLRGKA